MHFSLAVFHYPDEDVESLLAPFDENNTERRILFSRREGINFARSNLGCKGASDEECWKAAAKYFGDSDKDGNIYETTNPDARWDWWEEGGRWEGLLKVGSERVNSARVKDIDFDSKPFTTFAVLTPDGEWEEQDVYWGTDPNWEKHYKERFIDTAGPDMILTIVDCHI